MAKARILVVDDTDAILHLCARTLHQSLATERFDILLTDIRMPEVDGVTLLRLARQYHPP